MPDSFDGIHVGSLLCRDVAEEDTKEHADEERHVDSPHGHATGDAYGLSAKLTDRTAYQDADDAACDGDEHRLYQELERDDGSRGTDGHAQAYLLGALGDTDQHDIHDADTCHEQ